MVMWPVARSPRRPASKALLPAMRASAAVFAVIHPPLAMLPLFALGCAAWAFVRGGGLLAAMLTHALYNIAMMGVQAG